MQKIGLGGSCHWCTEAVFQSLNGVARVEQGFIRSHPPADSWSEAIIVHFDENRIGLDTLIEVHVRTHSSTARHSMRGKYRSAVYVFDAAQAHEASRALSHLNTEFEGALVTEILDYVGFRASDTRYHNYYGSDPDQPFCRRYIDPKLETVRQRFPENVGR